MPSAQSVERIIGPARILRARILRLPFGKRIVARIDQWAAE